MVKKVQKQKLVTGKDHAKFNKRQRFYNKFLRLVNNLKENDELESIISLTMKKKSVFPEYDDLSMLFLDLVSDQEEGDDTEQDSSEPVEKIDFSKGKTLEMPFIDEGYFIVNNVKEEILDLVYKETFENEDGGQRKGSAGSLEAYNYQSAYNWGLMILDYDKLVKSLKKEADEPSTYKIEVKMKKIERKRKYKKPWKPFRTRRR